MRNYGLRTILMVKTRLNGSMKAFLGDTLRQVGVEAHVSSQRMGVPDRPPRKLRWFRQRTGLVTARPAQRGAAKSGDGASGTAEEGRSQ
jgi:hypothetical protein